MVNVKNATEIVSELCLMKFFPAERGARTALVRMICEMAESEEQIRWLVTRALTLYDAWPGPKEMRALFCSKFKPLDGINAYSEVFADRDGIPSEKLQEHHQIEGSKRKEIAGPVTTDPEFGAAIQKLAAAKSLPPARRPNNRFTKELLATITAPRDRPDIPPPTAQPDPPVRGETSAPARAAKDRD